MRRGWVYSLVISASVMTFSSATALAQHNPGGFIESSGWNYLFPLLNPLGAAPAPEVMKQSWIAPSVIGDPDFNPRAGDEHGDDLDLPAIDFGGASPSPGYDGGGLVAVPTWFTGASLEGALSAPAGTLTAPDGGMNGQGGQLIDFQKLADFLNANAGATLPFDNVLGIATTYVNNPGAARAIDFCVGSDDSIQVWLNDKCVVNVSVPRGSGAAGECQNLGRAILPTGVSKISVLVWEGGGGHNFRCGIQDTAGVKFADGGDLEFLGPGADGDGLTGQSQYCLSRSVRTTDALECVTVEQDVTLQGTGPGDPGDVFDVCELIRETALGGADQLQLTNVSAGGVVSDLLRAETPGGLTPTNVLALDADAFVGTDAGAGSSASDDGGGAYTSVSTSGGDLWDGCDDFQFQYTNVSGDFDISLDFLERSHATGVGRWGKFGLMARQTLDRESRFTMIQDHLPDLQDVTRVAGRREHLTNCATMFEVAGPIPHPKFIRLTRRGTAITGWVSDDAGLADGSLNPRNDCNWIPVHTEDWGDAPDVLVGFANSEHNSDGVPAQTIRYQLLQGDSGDCAVIGKKITWTGVTRAELDAGLTYTASTGGAAASYNYDPSSGVLENDFTDGPGSLTFLTQSGPVGDFVNAHDIGAVVNVGSTSYDAGSDSYTVQGSGFDIWQGTGMNGHFAYKPVEGDFDARVRITDVQHPDAGRWGRYGLMARYGCGFKRAWTFAHQHAGNSGDGIDPPAHQFRPVDNCDNCLDASQVVDDGSLPGFPATGILAVDRRPPWLRLVRKGNAIYSYMAFADEAGEPIEWCLTGSDVAQNRPDVMLVGLAVGSHGSINGETLVSVTYDRFSCEPLDLVVPSPTQICIPGEAHLGAPLDFSSDAQLGEPVVRGGAFTPAVIDGRLRITEDGMGSSATAVWYGVPATSIVGGVPLIADGFLAEFDVFLTKGAGVCDPGADPNPADGMTFAVFSTGAEDGLASAVGPFPTGLDVASLGGDGGGALGYNGGSIRQRSECHPSFAIEVDIWEGGGNNEPAGVGSPNNDCNYHFGLDVNGYVDSIQTNVDHGVDSADLPSVFDPEGVHVEVYYFNDGRIEVYATGNAGGPRLQVLSSCISPLDPGDAVLGFTGGTGGATARQEIDNFSISSICCEEADSVVIDGPASFDNEMTAVLSAVFTGADADLTYAWSVDSGPGEIVGASDGESITLRCTGLGDVVVSLTAGDGVCADPASATHTVSCVCPIDGDTHCEGLTVDVELGEPGIYTVSAAASDDSGDAVIYSFEATDGVTTLTAGPQAESTASFDLTAGDWTISVTVDDDPNCDDAAEDNSCDVSVKVCPVEGDTHCQGLTVDPLIGLPGPRTVTASAVDDSGDAVIYTFTATDGVNVLTAGPQAEDSTIFDLNTSGEWTISVTVDDDEDCDDAAEDNSCEVTVLTGGDQLPGDCNHDGRLNLADAVCILDVLFRGSRAEFLCGDGDAAHPSNIEQLDVNGNGGPVDLSDAVYILQYLFLGGPPPVQGLECILIAGCSDNARCP